MRCCKTRADTALLLFPPWLVSLVDPIWRVSVIAGQLQSQSRDMLSDTSFASSVYAVTPNMVARAPTSSPPPALLSQSCMRAHTNPVSSRATATTAIWLFFR